MNSYLIKLDVDRMTFYVFFKPKQCVILAFLYEKRDVTNYCGLPLDRKNSPTCGTCLYLVLQEIVSTFLLATSAHVFIRILPAEQ